MNKTLTLSLLASFAFAGFARAEASFNASLWAPQPQLVSENEDVHGFRLEIYGRNRNVSGCDLGFGNEVTGDFTGVQIPGIFNSVGGSMRGAQLGVLNFTSGEVRGAKVGFFNWDRDHDAVFTGASVGLANMSRYTEITGAQVGIVNYAKSVHGAQIGLVNFADTLHGVQIGLWNQVNSRSWGTNDPLPRVFPIINIGH